MHFEHYSQPVIPFKKWLRRMAHSVWLAVMFASLMLVIGILGYRTLGGLSWIDSIVEASMILGGMGPVSTLANNEVKLFASAYALLSGLFIIGATGIIMGPWLHRILHFFYQERRTASRGADTRKSVTAKKG
jgi:hypothetical protein